MSRTRKHVQELDLARGTRVERGIIFSAPMVRRLLAGGKTQTRRLVKLPRGYEFDGAVLSPHADDVLCSRPEGPSGERRVTCPYGRPGDRLWVRETWRAFVRPSDDVDGVLFAADAAFVPIAGTREASAQWIDAYNNGRHGERWRPAIHMPRWAARLTLELERVRVQRLQSICDVDAHAEGVQCLRNQSPYDAFATLWDSIHEPGRRWQDNPLVWVLDFRVATTNTQCHEATP